MARNVKHAGKVSGSAEIEAGEPFGSTFQRSTTHAPELSKGVRTGKETGKIKPNGIVATAEGPTITCNDPAIDFPSRPAREMGSKVIATTESKGMKPPHTAGTPEDGGGRKGYALRKGYDKSGRTDRTTQSFK